MLSRAILFSLVATIGLLAGGKVWVSYLRVDTEQSVNQLKKEKVLLVQDVQNLKLELASMTRPDTLRRLARELGMAAPSAMQVMKP
ncbi:MAG TPA: cell division protein FtsL [Ghiorsea sp.]|nr:cell division protein FtsL [Ghiorsea sp.]HIP06399.1 cell division protein FtsL [Mariprofundaceae bacterium]